MTEAVARIKGGKLDARYTLLDKLGAGGQGEVWRAHDGTRGIDIALKVLNPTRQQAEAWSALEHEYAIASRLDHPSILKVFPPERSGEVMILPMELASGGDLRRLRGAGFLEIIPVLLEIAQALEHAHERGVVHRDLKPGNVLFDARGRARLADFGVAETAMTAGEAAVASAGAATRDINRHGFSPFTASPAQLRGEPPTPADDIYGLGALAYELLSGYPPYYPYFDKKRALEERVPALVPTRQIPPLLSALVMHLLEKDPKRRPRTMREVIDELDAALNDTLTFDFESVSARTPTASTSTVSTSSASSPAESARAPRQAESRQVLPQADSGQGSRTAASSVTDGPGRPYEWTPASQDRRASSDRRGRRSEDLTPPRSSASRGASHASDAGAGLDGFNTGARSRSNAAVTGGLDPDATLILSPDATIILGPDAIPNFDLETGPDAPEPKPEHAETTSGSNARPRAGSDATGRSISDAVAQGASDLRVSDNSDVTALSGHPATGDIADASVRRSGDAAARGVADTSVRSGADAAARGSSDAPARGDSDAPSRGIPDSRVTGSADADVSGVPKTPASAPRPTPRSGAEALARIDAALARVAADSARKPKPAHATPLTPAEAAAIVAAARAAASQPIEPSAENQPPSTTGLPLPSASSSAPSAASTPAPSSPSKPMWPRAGISTRASSAYATPGQPTTTHWAPEQTPHWLSSRPTTSHAPPEQSTSGQSATARPTVGHAASAEPLSHRAGHKTGSAHAAADPVTAGEGVGGQGAGSHAAMAWGHSSTASAPAAQPFGYYAAGSQSMSANHSPTVPIGTYASSTSGHTRPMHIPWGEIPLDALPKVARLQPIRARRWPWVFFGLLAAVAAVVYFWLPRFDTRTLPPEVAAFIAPLQAALAAGSASSPTSGTQAAAASATPDSSAALGLPAASGSRAMTGFPGGSGSSGGATTQAGIGSSASTGTAAASQSSRTAPISSAVDEQRLREMRQAFDARLAVLEARGAGVWGGREFATAKTRAAESVGAYDAGNSRVAQERLVAATKLLDTVEGKAPEALSAQVAAGEKALGAGQQGVAGQAFELARRINPADLRASDGQRRAQNLNAVLPLLADAQNAETAHNYARAAQDYSQALSLDPGNATAKAGQARANAAFGDDNYAKAVGSGFAALGAGRLDEAHEAFVKARALKPSGAEASEGLRRVGAALTARGFASMRQRAAGLEAQERWDEAQRTYEDVLAADPSLAFAQEGKARTTSRADLSGRLQQLLDRPDGLSVPGVREDARALLETAKAQSPQGPVIRSQIARLEILLPGFDKPVRLSLLSDNSTQIVIPSIGSFGSFARRDIELRPGKYTVVGTRYGFRDVRREITVAPGQDAQTIRVTCSDPI